MIFIFSESKYACWTLDRFSMRLHPPHGRAGSGARQTGGHGGGRECSIQTYFGMLSCSHLDSRCRLDDPVAFARRIHRMIALGLALDEPEDAKEPGPDLPPPEEQDQGSRMEEVGYWVLGDIPAWWLPEEQDLPLHGTRAAACF